MSANGGVIDVDLIINNKYEQGLRKFESDSKQSGESAGNKLREEFERKPAMAKLKTQADEAGVKDFKKLLDSLPKDKQTELLAKANKGEAINFKKVISEIPKDHTTALIAQAKEAGIDNFKKILNSLPKDKRVELLAKANKGEAIDFEKLMHQIPAKKVSKLELNDQASVGLKRVRNEADETGRKFKRLKDIIAGTVIANGVIGGFHAITNGLKEATKAGMEYNKEQDTMKTVWTALTTEAPKDGQELVKYINDLSQHSIYAADNINEMAQSFYHVHSNVEETKKWTDAFVALGSTLHMTGPQISESGEMFAKIVAGGKASSEDMAVMINRFPMFGEALQEATGKSMKQLYDMSAKGKLTADQFTQTLDFLGKKYAGGTAEAMTSFQGMSMYISSRWSTLWGQITKTSFNASKEQTKTVKDLLSDDMLGKYANAISSAFGKVFGVVSTVLGYIDKHKNTIMDIIGNMKTIIGIIGATVWKTFSDIFYDIANMFGLVGDKSKGAVDPLKTIDDVLKNIANHKEAIENVTKAILAFMAVKKAAEFVGIQMLMVSVKHYHHQRWPSLVAII